MTAPGGRASATRVQADPAGHRTGVAAPGTADDGSVAAWLVLTVLLVVPVLVLGAWALVARADNPTQAAAPVDPVVVAVTRQDVRAQTSVTIKLGDAPGREVVTGATGTVTAAPAVGVVLDDGVEVMRVDDRPLRALTSPAPPWRSLAVGATGADVARVQEFLLAAGYYRGPVDGTYGRAMRASVEKFNVDAGLGKGVSTFEPATVVWVGPEPLTVAEPLVAVGAVVAPGAPVLRAPVRHAVVAVTEPQGGVSSAGQFGGGAELVVGAVVVPYVPGSGSVTAQADVDLVRGALAPVLEGVAKVRAVDSQEVDVVPASALVQGADGSLCVYASQSASPVLVQPLGGGVGTVHLPVELPLEEVVANPGRLTMEVACGS